MNESEGVYHLATDADTVSVFGSFSRPESRVRPWVISQFDETNELIVQHGFNHEVYCATDDSYSPIRFSKILYPGFSDPVVLNGQTYYSIPDTLGRSRLFQIINDSTYMVPVEYSGSFDSDNYSLSINYALNDSTIYLSLLGPNMPIVNFLKGNIVDGVLKISPLIPPTLAGRRYLIKPEFFSTRTAIGDSVMVQVWNYVGQELYRYTMPADASFLDISLDGAFYLQVIPGNYEPVFLYASNQGETSVLANAEITPARFNRDYYVVNGRLLFTADTPDFGREWAVADPESETVTLLKDINPGRGWSRLSRTVALQTERGIFFDGYDPMHGSELWFSDGTTAGTYRVADINYGPGSSNPSNFVELDGGIFFSANGPAGYEVYRMDADSPDPALVIDLNPGSASSLAYGFREMNGALYFFGRESVGETFELYRINFDLVPTKVPLTHSPAKVFPNPAGNQPVTVEAPEGEAFLRTQIFNTAGQLLQENAAPGARIQLDLSDLPAGTYWVRTWYASGRFSLNAVQRSR
ncbi:MAG: ELWxxDGT repeat protein [Bacteroidota bacterium]